METTIFPQLGGRLNQSQKYTLGILAGGTNLRWQQRKKHHLPVRGAPLCDHVVRALRPHFAHIILDAVTPHYLDELLFDEVCTSVHPTYLGPCAGIELLLARTQTEWLVTWPGDLLCTDPYKLIEPLLATDDPRGCAHLEEDGQHLGIIKLATHLRGDVSGWLEQGGRSMIGLLRTVNSQSVACSAGIAYADINDPMALRRWLD